VDFLTTLRVLLSRWYVVVPALALTALAVTFTARTAAPSWQATGTVVLLGPAATGEVMPGSGEPVRMNPYLEFGGALEVAADVMSKVMSGDTMVERLRAKGATAPYEVGTGVDGASPVINVIATGDDPDQAKVTVQVVIRELRAELSRRQAAVGAPRAQFIRVEQVTTPGTAKRLMGSTLRAAAAVLALGVVLTFALAFLADALGERRAARRRRATTMASRRVPGTGQARDGGTSPEPTYLRAASHR
jgi:hypothetical protein